LFFINFEFTISNHAFQYLGGLSKHIFVTDQQHIFGPIEPAIDIRIVPGLSHMDMLHAPTAIDAVAAAFKEK